jgi:chromosome segregation ATPase
MPTIETDLAKILERIEAKIDGVAKDVVDIKIELTATKGELTAVKTELKGEIKALDEKITGLSKRVDSVDFINRGVFVALIIAILGGFAKIFGFIGNP